MLANVLVLRGSCTLLGARREGRTLAASRELIPDRSMAASLCCRYALRCCSCRHNARESGGKDSLSSQVAFDMQVRRNAFRGNYCGYISNYQF